MIKLLLEKKKEGRVYHEIWRHVNPLAKAPLLKDEQQWHGGPGSFLRITAFESVAELIAYIIATVPKAATMVTIAHIAVGFIGTFMEKASIQN